ncbi:MAG TPA: hypothetical protein ENJ75_01245 [Candidatus Kaiserbacteria bacterium]|nr:hypothetical protein [Candidatus Kaiserbacteria bacterium]
MPRKIIAQIAILASVFFLSVGLQGFAAFTEPTQAPPYANASAPINIGSTAQTKTGTLTVGDTAIDNGSYAIQASKPIYTANYVQAGSSALNWQGYGLSTSLPVYSSSYIRTHSSVRSPRYCDENGLNCTTSTGLGGLSCITRTGPGTSYVFCPSGYVATGGGINGTSNQVDATYPIGNGWRCRGAGASACYVRCCK